MITLKQFEDLNQNRLLYKNQPGNATSIMGVPIDPDAVAANDGEFLQKVDGEWTPVAISLSGLTYKGTWDASTNDPVLADGVGTSGDWYKVSVAGDQDLGSGTIHFNVGDWVVYSSDDVWQLQSSGVQFEYSDYVPQATPPTYQEGRFYYDAVKKSFSGFNDISDVIVNFGEELTFRVYNGTLATITNGSVVCPDATTGIALADTRYREKSKLIAVATHDIAPGTWGRVTRLGSVGSLDTTGWTQNQTIYLGQNGAWSETMPTDGGFTTVVGVVDVVDASVGEITVDVVISQLSAEVTDTNGFPSDQRTGTTMSVDTGTLEFTIAPTGSEFHFYQLGMKYEKDAAQTVSWTDVEGGHAFYFDEGVLTHIANPTNDQIKDIILNKCFVAGIYWDATNKEIIGDIWDERHGISMSPATHAYNHITRGAQFIDGLGLGNFVIGDGTLDTHAQFSVEAGEFADEDISHEPSAISVGTAIPVIYNLGAGVNLREDTQANFAVLNAPAGRLYYNQFTGGAWQLTEASDNSFVLYHDFAVNGQTVGTLTVMGQNEYANITQARVGAGAEIASIATALELEEIVPISTRIYQTRDSYTNSVKARIVQTDTGENYVDWRTTEFPRGAAPTDHTNLTNLAWPNSGHSGTANTVAGFDSLGDATEYSTKLFDYEATVGIGGDYTTVKAALDDGKTLLKGFGSIAETAVINIPAGGFSLFLEEGSNWNLQTYAPVWTAADSPVYINGKTYRGGTITFSGSGYAFNQTATYISEPIYINKCIIDISDPAGSSATVAYGKQFINDAEILIGNENRAVRFNEENSGIDNVTFVGGGTLCSEVLYFAANDCYGTNLHFKGTFSSGAETISSTSAQNCTLSNLTFATYGRIRLPRGTITNITASSGVNVDVYVAFDQTIMDSFNLGSGLIDFADGTDNCHLSSVNCGDIDVHQCDSTKLVGINSSGTITIDADATNTKLAVIEGTVTDNAADTQYLDSDLSTHIAASNPHSGSAPLASPALTGNPTAPTQTAGDNSTKLATTEYVDKTTLNTKTGTTYTLALTDIRKIVEMNNASANTLTIPTNAAVALPIGTTITVVQYGAGLTTVSGDIGVTVNGTSAGSVATTAQYEGLALYKRGTDEWIVVNKVSV